MSRGAKRVFVAGPLGGAGRCEAEDQFKRVRAALEAGVSIRQAGGMPIIPHLYWFWATLVPGPLTREDWIAMDDELLRDCDALLRLPGASPGADREVGLACSLGLPVFVCDDAGAFPHDFWGWLDD